MTKKEASDAQEKMIAKLLGWRQVTGSGSRNNFPGDVSGDEWLGECKTHVTTHKVVFKESVWDKIREEATARFKYPVYFSDNGWQRPQYTWVVFSERELPKEFSVIDYPKDVKSSLSFDATDMLLSITDNYDVAYLFAFNTKSNELSTKKRRLLLTKLSVFERLLSC